MKNTLLLSATLLLSTVSAHPHGNFRASLNPNYRLPRRQASGARRNPQYQYQGDTQDLFLSGNCTNSEIRQVINGWAEAGYLAEALTLWDPPTTNTYNRAVDLYMGNDSLAFEDRLKSNSQRAYALHTGPQPSADTHFWIYCNNPTPKEGSSNCTADLYAFVWTEEGSVERNHYMAACPMYFDADKTPTMATALDTVRTGAKSLTNIDSYTNNKGSVILHETSHWNYTVGRPEIVDYIPPDEDNKIYGAQQVTQSAQTNNVAGNSQVAEAYELESAAILAMELFGLDGPPVYVPEGKRKRQNGADDENEDTVGPPPGFNAPSDPNTPGIDATILEWDPAGAPDELQANVHAWYRVSGSMATIHPDDYTPKPVKSKSTSNCTTPTPKPTPVSSPSSGGSGAPYSPYDSPNGGGSLNGGGSPAPNSPYGPAPAGGNGSPSLPSYGSPGNGQRVPNPYGPNGGGSPSGNGQPGSYPTGGPSGGGSPSSGGQPGSGPNGGGNVGKPSNYSSGQGSSGSSSAPCSEGFSTSVKLTPTPTPRYGNSGYKAPRVNWGRVKAF